MRLLAGQPPRAILRAYGQENNRRHCEINMHPMGGMPAPVFTHGAEVSTPTKKREGEPPGEPILYSVARQEPRPPDRKNRQARTTSCEPLAISPMIFPPVSLTASAARFFRTMSTMPIPMLKT